MKEVLGDAGSVPLERGKKKFFDHTFSSFYMKEDPGDPGSVPLEREKK